MAAGESSLRPQSLASPTLAIKGALCWTCLNETKKRNRCTGCKRVWYCSQECQKKDWKTGHKKLCPKLATMNGLTLDDSRNPQTWKKYREEMLSNISSWEGMIPFDSMVQRFLRLQPYCTKCYRSTFQLPAGTTLSSCDACQLAHHCSSCPPSHDETHCVTLQGISQAERFQISHFLETKNEWVPRMLTESPRASYVALSTVRSWYDYYTEVSDKTMIADLISPDLEPLKGNLEMACALRAATGETSMMLTIIAAMESVHKDLATKETLNLHLIGSNARELESLLCFEELLHLLPRLRSLNCSFIGVDLPNPIDGTNTISLDCCPSCTGLRRTRSMSMWKGKYHDYIKSEHYKKPDLAVAFHTGHSLEEQQSWLPTIKHLVESDHATVFTTFNEAEMLGETNGLKQLRANFVVDGQKNKWKGMRPMLDPLEEKENIAYYHHYYWYVVAGHGIKV